MNKTSLFSIVSVITFLILINPCQGFSQDETNANYNDRGFYLGASLMGTSWNPGGNDEMDFGFGLAIKAGYNFTSNVGLFISLDGSDMYPSDTESYVVTHFDLGIKGIFGSDAKRVRPFGRASYIGMAAVDEGFEITGEGLGVGAGLNVYASEKVSLEFSYNHSWITVTNGNQLGPVSEDHTNTGRLMIGAAYHF
ncbi:MAG: outer membrane beta-barrel protein [Balneolaceae bacterium]